MKQHITVDQLNELSEEHRESIRELWKPMVGDVYFNFSSLHTDAVNNRTTIKPSYLPLLSIGQMIEYLDEHYSLLEIVKGQLSNSWHIQDRSLPSIVNLPKFEEELCDRLWSAVKEVLNKEVVK